MYKIEQILQQVDAPDQYMYIYLFMTMYTFIVDCCTTQGVRLASKHHFSLHRMTSSWELREFIKILVQRPPFNHGFYMAKTFPQKTAGRFIIKKVAWPETMHIVIVRSACEIVAHMVFNEIVFHVDEHSQVRVYKKHIIKDRI